MCVGCYKCDSIFFKFEENTCHGGTKIVVADSKNRLIDSSQQSVTGHAKA